MADAEAETTKKDKKRKGLFGRRKDEVEEERLRSDTEWVDTLYPAGPGESVPEGHPFEGEDLPEASTEEPYTGGIPEDEGPSRPVSHSGWRRRSDESIGEIEYFIDNVLGRGGSRGHRARAASRVAPSAARFQSTEIEGLGEDVPLALPFPHSELRGARMIYETEGGYVIEVKRAVGGDDKNLEAQHYTVSRMGEVKHVLDRLRRFETRAEAKAALDESTTEHVGAGHEAPAATGTSHGVEEPVYQAEGPFTEEPETPPSPTPEPDVIEKSSAPDPDVVEKTPAPEPEAETPADATQGMPDHGDLPEEDAPAKKKGFLGLGKKKDKGADEGSEGPAVDTGAEAADEGDGTEAGKKRGFMGFGKKKAQDDDSADAASEGREADPDAEAVPGPDDLPEEKPAKKGFLGFRKRKGGDDADPAEEGEEGEGSEEDTEGERTA